MNNVRNQNSLSICVKSHSYSYLYNIAPGGSGVSFFTLLRGYARCLYQPGHQEPGKNGNSLKIYSTAVKVGATTETCRPLT